MPDGCPGGLAALVVAALPEGWQGGCLAAGGQGRALAFVAGAASVLAGQLGTSWLWRSDVGSREVGGSCEELRHMAGALHAQVDLARQLLEECRANGDVLPATGTAVASGRGIGMAGLAAVAGGSELLDSSVAVLEPTVLVVDVGLVLHSLEAAALGPQMVAPAVVHSVTPLRHLLLSSWAWLPWACLWSLVLLLVDSALLVFVLHQSLEPAAWLGLETRLAAIFRALPRGLGEKVGLLPPASGAYRTGGRPRGRLQRGSSSSSSSSSGSEASAAASADSGAGGRQRAFMRSRVDLAGNAFVVAHPPRGRRHRPRRRQGAAARRQVDQTSAESIAAAVAQRRRELEEQRRHQVLRYCANVALAMVSFGGVLCIRGIMLAAGALHYRFVEHLLMYGVLTLRLCLVVMLVLF